MAKKLTQKTAQKIDRIKTLLQQLSQEGYVLDFVEDSVVLVEVKALKAEMDRCRHQHHNHIDIDAYVVAVLK